MNSGNNHSENQDQHNNASDSDSGHSGDDKRGDDGYEYHYTTTTNHDLHGNDLANSVLVGSKSDDNLWGGSGNDVLDGSDGNNTLEGGDGDDILITGGLSDHGQNHLDGGKGDDILVAGGTKTHHLDDFFKANESIVLAVTTDAKYASLAALVKSSADDDGSGNGVENIFGMHSGNGHDRIYNFHANTDKVQVERGINGSEIRDMDTLIKHITVNGNDLSIDFGGGNSVTLVGVDVAHLSAANVEWA